MTLLQNLTKHSLAYLHCVAYGLFFSLLCKNMSRFERLKFSFGFGLTLYWIPMLTQHLYSCKRLTNNQCQESCVRTSSEQNTTQNTVSYEKLNSETDITVKEHFEPQ